jgi:hypothetical protein
MISRLLVAFLAFGWLTAPSPAQSQSDASAHRGPWSSDTAILLPEGRIETGLFAPMRVGLGGDVELQAHPIWTFMAPHLGAKAQWLRQGSWTLATRHTLSYPTPLLGMLSRSGTGGVLPEDTQVPHILNLTQDVLLSWAAGPDQLVTVRSGLRLAAAWGKSTLVTVDLPVIFPRSAAWHDGISGEVGLAWAGQLRGPVHASLAVDLFLMADPVSSYSLEQTATLKWRISPHWALMGGVKYVSGAYPFGEQSHVLPLVDLTYAWRAFGGDA